MIDLEWIASQPKPVAIHCPTYHDIMTVLCDVNEHLLGGPLTDEMIIEITNSWWESYGENVCVRVKTVDNKFEIYRHRKSFYEENAHYILVSIDQVKRKFDLGEIESDNTDLSALFGMEAES